MVYNFHSKLLPSTIDIFTKQGTNNVFVGNTDEITDVKFVLVNQAK